MKSGNNAPELRQLRLAHTLQKVGAMLTATLSLEEVFGEVFALLADVVAYDSVSIQLFDSNGRLYLAAGRGFPDLARIRRVVSSFPKSSSNIITPQQPVLVIRDTHLSDRWYLHPDTAYIRCWIGAALMIKGELIGLLNVDSATVDAYDAEDAQMVAAFANQAAVAIENARLHREARQRADKLAVLHQVALATAALVDVDELIEETTKLVARRLSYDYFGFASVDEWSGRIFPHSSFQGLEREVIEQGISLQRSGAATVVSKGQPQITDLAAADGPSTCLLPQAYSQVLVPVVAQQQVVGLLGALSCERGAFSGHDIDFLTTLAGQLAAAIERTQLYDALQRDALRLSDKVAEKAQALQAERDRTQAILDSAGEGIFFASPTGIIIYLNEASSRLTGYEAGEVLGRSLFDWFGEQVQPEVRSYLHNAVASGRGWSGEMSGQHRDGSSYDVRLTLAPIYDEQSELSGFVGVQFDITRLRQVERLKSQLITNVSHELRTPLTSIKTYIALLRIGYAEKREEYLNTLEKESERLTYLIQDLLDVSHLETFHEEYGPVSISALVREAIDEQAAFAEKRQVRIVEDMPPTLPPVRGARQQLLRAVNNLVKNGLAYTPGGGCVILTAGVEKEENDEIVWLRVKDTGPGIPESEIVHIFEHFYRGQAARGSVSIPGAGLGLGVSRQIIERHGGKIVVSSGPEQGAVFHVRLPAMAREGYSRT